jgi:hypothetical protein
MDTIQVPVFEKIFRVSTKLFAFYEKYQKHFTYPHIMGTKKILNQKTVRFSWDITIF